MAEDAALPSIPHRRSAKDTTSQSDDSGTFAQRLLLDMQVNHPRLLLVFASLHLAFELLDLAIYTWVQYTCVCTFGHCWHTLEERADPLAQEVVFYIQGVLHLWFLGGWIGLFWAASEKVSFLLSRWSLITLVTSLSVLVFTIASFAGASWSFRVTTNGEGEREGEFPWTPEFLRIWTFYDTVLFFLNYMGSGLSSPRRAIIEMVLSLFSTMVTCFCFFQASQSYFEPELKYNMFESLYFAVVTFGTIGFGDIKPTHWVSRLITVFIVVVAVYTFPAFFSNIATVARRLSLFNSYSNRSGQRRHVIFAGRLGSREINYFINEFCGGFRRFDDLHIVVLSPEDYSQEMRMRVNSPELNHRVHLMIGDARRRSDLDRADAAHADCIFIANSDDLAATEVDAEVVLTTTTVFQYDPKLPQNIVIRRERNTQLVKDNNVHNVLEKERLKFSLLGTGVLSSGAIPLLINLVRSYDSDIEAESAVSWQEQTEWSMGNEIYSFRVPDVLVNKSFLQCVFLYRKATISVIGVVSEDGNVRLNPKGFFVGQNTMLLALAADDQIIKARSDELLQNPEEAHTSLSGRLVDVVELAAVSSHQHQIRVASKRRPNADAVVRLTTSDKDVLAGLSGHVVLFDLHSAHREQERSRQATVLQESFRATDLFNMMRSIRLQKADMKIVLVSRGHLHPSFDEMWREAELDPIYHVDGCGLSAQDLAAVRVTEAKGALVFSTAESTDPDADTMTMLVTASIEDACRKAKRPVINIVSDIKHMESLTLVPPYYTEDRMSHLAAENFAFEPAFVVGRVISSSMLDSALYQTYFNPEILRIVDAFIYGDGKSASLSSMPVPPECRTYADVEYVCAKQGFLPIALNRMIKDDDNKELLGFRYMFVNPHSDCEILATDEVYFVE